MAGLAIVQPARLDVILQSVWVRELIQDSAST